MRSLIRWGCSLEWSPREKPMPTPSVAKIRVSPRVDGNDRCGQRRQMVADYAARSISISDDGSPCCSDRSKSPSTFPHARPDHRLIGGVERVRRSSRPPRVWRTASWQAMKDLDHKAHAHGFRRSAPPRSRQPRLPGRVRGRR